MSSILFSAEMTDIIKPEVTILGTGGTIAGRASSHTDTTDYAIGGVGVDSLVEMIPEVKEFAEVRTEEIANINSSNMDSTCLLRLSQRVNELLDQGQQGIVITHGTDTIEETAFFWI